MSHIRLTQKNLIGSYEWKGNRNLFNIAMIGLAKELPEHDEKYELHRLLGTLLSQNLTEKERLDIIGMEYNIPLKKNLRKDVNVMCNLSEGIEERGITIGEARGRAVGESTALKLIQLLMKEGRTADIERASTDPEARQKLYQEFHLI